MANHYPLAYVSSNLNKIMSEMVDSYEKELKVKAEKVTEKVATDFAEQLKVVTPRSRYGSASEHLADTVVISERGEKFKGGKHRVLYVHYTKWQIAHLLEFGWTLRNGQRLERTPFIRPLFDKNKDKYVRMYKEALQ